MAEHHNITTQVNHSRPRQPDNTCAKCRQKFKPNDRVNIAYIVQGDGADPLNLSRRGLYLYEEFEFTHVDCSDPSLMKGP
jgi:hypothetical protein